MSELKLIKQLEELKQVKPNPDWVVFTKKAILAQEKEKEPRAISVWLTNLRTSYFAPVLSCVAFSVLFAGFVVAVQDSVPGDKLYAFKKAGEGIEVSLASPQEKAIASFDMIERRMVDLDKILQESKNQGNRLAAGISEVNDLVPKISEEWSLVPEQDRQEVASRIIEKIENIKNQQETIEKNINAVIIDDEQLLKEWKDTETDIYKAHISFEISNLESSTLTEEQAVLFDELKAAYENEDIDEAMELLNEIYNKK